MRLLVKLFLFCTGIFLVFPVFAAGSLDSLFEQGAEKGNRAKAETSNTAPGLKSKSLDALLEQEQQEEAHQRQIAEEKHKAEEARQRRLAEEKRRKDEERRLAEQRERERERAEQLAKQEEEEESRPRNSLGNILLNGLAARHFSNQGHSNIANLYANAAVTGEQVKLDASALAAVESDKAAVRQRQEEQRRRQEEEQRRANEARQKQIDESMRQAQQYNDQVQRNFAETNKQLQGEQRQRQEQHLAQRQEQQRQQEEAQQRKQTEQQKQAKPSVNRCIELRDWYKNGEMHFRNGCNIRVNITWEGGPNGGGSCAIEPGKATPCGGNLAGHHVNFIACESPALASLERGCW